MTDKEIYERFMSWMGMKLSKTKRIESNTVVKYKDTNPWDKTTNSLEDKFTTCGYDRFYSGAIFDKDGNIVKAYIDSHVAFTSKNSDDIEEMLKD